MSSRIEEERASLRNRENITQGSQDLDEEPEIVYNLNASKATSDRNNTTVNNQSLIQSPAPANTSVQSAPRKQQRLGLIGFARKSPILTVFICAFILIVLILVIVLPIALVKPRDERPVSPRCPDGKSQPRIECLPDKEKLQQQGGNLQNTCSKRGCCWSSSPELGGPNCAFPTNFGFRNFKTKEHTFSSQWLELLRMNSPDSLAKSDIANLEIKAEMQTDTRLRIKIFPRRNFKNKIQRWEVPTGIHQENVFKPNYKIEYSNLPFSFKVSRVGTNTTIFDTTDSSLIFSDQLLQITTKLPSPYVFGIGENNKDTFMHDLNFKSWPLFASQNHPSSAKERTNLYSQFPTYLNIEPDGNSHLVVFYNSNPSEFYLTPFPSLTFRSIGGILDIYIFTGPTPIQAIEQFQQAFGLPKLPPYWSMGLQVGTKRFRDAKHLREFIYNMNSTRLGYDSVLVGYEHMKNATMFTLDDRFLELNSVVDELRSQHRAAILELLPAIGNNTQNLPFSEGNSKERYWILENFFSTGVVGKLLGRHVLYPDFTMEKTIEWWKDALQRYVLTDQVIRFDGIFLDYLRPVDESESKTCPNNKWNNPRIQFDFLPDPIYNGTICMDSRYELGKQFNIHGVNSHFIIEATAMALDTLIPNRTLIMTRHAFIGSGQYSSKWLGQHDPKWDDLRRFIIASVEIPMFGFSQAGGDICGSHGSDLDFDLCENWIKASGLSPMMKLVVDTGDSDDARFNALLKSNLFEVFNASVCLRYTLLPYLYTQFYKATRFGTVPVRPLAFEYPLDQRAFKIENQWLWGDSLMVAVAASQGGLSSVYLPRGDWFDYYRGFHRPSNGEFVNVQVRRNETSLNVRGGGIVFKQDCMHTATESKYTYIDVIIALNISDNFTARGELYVDDSTKKNTERKENYHRLISFDVYRNENDGIIEVRKKSGRYLTKLSYRDLIILGLRSKPYKITVNENSQSVDSSKTVWDEVNRAYHVNLQTEVKKKVLLDVEYLSFRWTGGFEFNGNRNYLMSGENGQNEMNNFNYMNNDFNNNNNNNNNDFNNGQQMMFKK